MALLPYRCIWDTVEIDLREDEDFAFITVLMRHWKFDEFVERLTAAGRSECVVSLDDVLNEEERPVLDAMMHLTELGIREGCYGGIISGLIEYIEEEIISNLSPPVTVTLDIVEATPAVATDDIQEALELYLMEADAEEEGSSMMMMEIDTTVTPSEAAVAEMMGKLQRCGADKEGEELFCVICMEEGGVGFAVMPCKHVFHVTCVARWFTINPLCPLCRQTIFTA
uniref:RING-type E3 ubiquitin transferase n=1 Tax=Kalanchoe fedtschenkoi TaxID=63787 RepID=A0A7N0UC51_KALFE